MGNELNIEECSNNCSILTYFQVMEQVNNFDNIEFEDVPNVFNIDFMNFILKKKFHEIAIVDIFVGILVIINLIAIIFIFVY